MRIYTSFHLYKSIVSSYLKDNTYCLEEKSKNLMKKKLWILNPVWWIKKFNKYSYKFEISVMKSEFQSSYWEWKWHYY